MAENESEEFWNQSDLSSKTKGFFNEDPNTDFPNLSERIFCGETNTIEDFTEKLPNSKSSTSLRRSSESNAAKNAVELHRKEPKKWKMEATTPRGTVIRIILGESYSLDMYKSKEDKLMMLDEAIASHDGNAILVIVLFLERTMKPSLFNLEMSKRPIAVVHYLSYLQSDASSVKYADALNMFHKTERAAMLKFKLANNAPGSSRNPNLQKCLVSHFQSDANLSFEASLVRLHIDLLELQAPIQENDEKEAMQGTNLLMKEIPPSVSLMGTSALTTLYYSCLYHFEKPENFLGSPASVKKAQRLTDKQFIWKAVSSLSRLKRWNQIEALFLTKSWVGGSKMKSPIPFERVASLLHQMSAPREIKGKYCLLIDDVDKKIEMAIKCGCHEVVLQTYKDLRNRKMIEKYRLNLKSNTPEDYFASEILNDMTIKWKH